MAKLGAYNYHMATRKQMMRWMREIWRVENDRIFGGKLPRPCFHVFNGTADQLTKIYSQPDFSCDFAGLQWIDPLNRHHIGINIRFVKTKKALYPVFVHEMIHQLQLLQKSERTRREHHGRFFVRHALRIIVDYKIPVRIYFD